MTSVGIFQIVNVILLAINLVFVWLNIRTASSPSPYMTSDVSFEQSFFGGNPPYFYLGNAGPGVARSVRCRLYLRKSKFDSETGTEPVFPRILS